MRVLALFTLIYAGCSGSDDKPTDDTAGGDADTDTDADTDADTDTDTAKDTAGGDDTAHGDDTGAPPPPVGEYSGPPRVVMIVDDSVVVYDLETSTATTVSGLTVHSDAIADCAGEALFVLESRSVDGDDDRVIRIDPVSADWDEWTLGNNYQPKDIASVAGNFWVANWGKPRISTFTPEGAAGSFIELGDYADSDGLPETNGIANAGGIVYITVARQSGTTYNGAKILEVLPDTTTVARAGDLTGSSPSGKIFPGGDSLFVHLQPTVDSGGSNADGGVEKVTTADLTSAGLTLDDSATSFVEDAAAFDSQAPVVWTAGTASTGSPTMVGTSLIDGTTLQTWPLADRVSDFGVANGMLWLGENPFSGGNGALVSRDPATGVESTREDLDGTVYSVAVCSAPSGGGGGGGGKGKGKGP